MSGKVQKQIRKLAKQELEKRMQPNQQPQKPSGIQIISALEEFIQLSIVLTGEKPSSISLTEIMHNMYVQEAQRHAETLGLNPGFKTEEPTFLGVKLIKKSSLIMPSTVNISTPPKEEPKN